MMIIKIIIMISACVAAHTTQLLREKLAGMINKCLATGQDLILVTSQGYNEETVTVRLDGEGRLPG